MRRKHAQLSRPKGALLLYCFHREVVLLAIVLVFLAQTHAGEQTALSISPGDISRRIHIIADDSMRGRDTPSPELDKVAVFIARDYKRWGLKPGGDHRTFIQRYTLNRVRVADQRSIAFVRAEGNATLRYGTDFLFPNNLCESGDYAGELVLATGSLGNATGDTAGLDGKMVLLVTPRLRGADRERVFRWKPGGVILVSNAPDSIWSRAVSRSLSIQTCEPTREVGGPLLLIVRAAALQRVISTIGANLAATQSARAFTVTSLRGARLHIHARIETVEQRSAPNVVAILEGSDPKLKNEYVVFSAHMDHIGIAGPKGSGGCQANGADSICNGADDDGSGTVAVMEIAKALAGLHPRPMRSIIFLNVSGEEKGLWGSYYFIEHPAVPVDRIVADLNIDMIGRNWKDTIVAIGKEYSNLGVTLDRVASAHPELHIRPIDDIWPEQGFYSRSDHFNFARKGVPALFFFSGTHEDYHQAGDSPDKIDTEKESRVALLICYLGVDVANAADRPRWNPDSYRSIVLSH
jgi:peptidase M28-like protein